MATAPRHVPRRRHPRTSVALAGAVVAALLLVGCGDVGGAGGSTDVLDGTWVLTAGSGPDGALDLDVPVDVTLVIGEGEWRGAVCNHYGAPVTVTAGGQVRIEGDGVSRTEMACLEPGVMELEDAYLTAFVAVDRWAIDGDVLTLTGEGVELVYDYVPPVPDAPLVGPTWVLDSLIHGAGPDGAVSSVMGSPNGTPELVLADDGTYTAHDGCNGITGRYEHDGTTLHLVEAIQTDIGCPTIEDQLRHLHDVLFDGPMEVTIEADRLTLVRGDRGLIYRSSID